MSHQDGSELDRDLFEGVPDDQQVEAGIKDALMWENRIDMSAVQVRVTGGVVALTGQVRTTEEKELIENVVWGVRGVGGVDNRLQVARAA